MVQTTGANAGSSSADAPRGAHAIYNFDHGIRSPHSFWLGPYRIRVKEEHIKPGILARGTTQHYSSQLDENGELRRVVATTPAHSGRWAPTAEIEDHDNLRRRSILLPDVPGRTERDDVALILSFLTGRDVIIGNDAPQQFWLRSGERLVSETYFYRPNIEWGALPSVAAAGGAEAMYVVCLAMSSSELLMQLALGSASLDSLSGSWYSVDGKSRYDKVVREKFSRAKPAFETALRENGMDESLIEDMMPRLSNVCSESAVAKLQAFLVAHGMFPTGTCARASGRLALLNKHRNAVLHRATLHVVKGISFEINAQIASAVATLLLIICRVYVGKFLLKIDDGEYGIERDRKTVLTFFDVGRFREQDVFEESFEDYLERLEENWVNRGEFPSK